MDVMGSGISNKMNAQQEREELERIEKNYKPRGTHTLGIMFDSKRPTKKTSEADVPAV